MTRHIAALVAFVLLGATAAPVALAQDTAPAVVQGATAPVAEYGATPAVPAAPPRAAPPRTLRAHAHVYVAFAATWLLLFGYAISVGRRASRIEAEINRLRG